MNEDICCHYELFIGLSIFFHYSTDMYLYAVDPLLNSVVDMNDLQQ